MRLIAFFAIFALLTACYNRATTTSHTEKRATERHETLLNREIHHEQASTNELYTNISQYDSLLIEKDTAGGVKLRIYGGKQASASALLKNETSRHETKKELDITITDSSDIAHNEDTQIGLNAHTPKQIESKTWIGCLFVLAIFAILISIEIIKNKRPVQMRDC